MSNEVENLLKEKGIRFMVSGNDYLTKCFNPDHEDSNPSFRIDKIKGIGHCFSCGFKFNIFKHYGLITNTVNIKVAGLNKSFNDNHVLKDISFTVNKGDVWENLVGNTFLCLCVVTGQNGDRSNF